MTTEVSGSKNILSTLDTMITDVKSNSVQFQFAMLQLEQSAQCKKQAEDYMKQIEDIQNEQKLVADMIAQARKLQNDAKTGNGDCSWDSEASVMPDEMVKFFKDRGLSFDTTGKDNVHNEDEWDYNLKSLTNYQEQIGNKTQTLMVYLQDFIGQYNSYLEGAKSSIDKGVSTLSTVNAAVR